MLSAILLLSFFLSKPMPFDIETQNSKDLIRQVKFEREEFDARIND